MRKFQGVIALAGLFLLTGWLSAQTITISGDRQDLPAQGGTVEVTIGVTGGQTFANGLAGLSYNPAVVEYVSASPGSVLGKFFQPPIAKNGAVWATGNFIGEDNRTAEGTLAIFTFRVIGPGQPQFATQVKSSMQDPDHGRTALVQKGGKFLPLSVERKATGNDNSMINPEIDPSAMDQSRPTEQSSGTAPRQTPFIPGCGAFGMGGLLFGFSLTVMGVGIRLRQRTRRPG